MYTILRHRRLILAQTFAPNTPPKSARAEVDSKNSYMVFLLTGLCDW